jgi:hypothetical protein
MLLSDRLGKLWNQDYVQVRFAQSQFSISPKVCLDRLATTQVYSLSEVSDEKSHVAIMLMHINPKEVLDEFGDDGIFFAECYYGHNDFALKRFTQNSQELGFSISNMDRARVTTWQRYGSRDYQVLKTNYAYNLGLETLCELSKDPEFMRQLLSKYAKGNISISLNRASDYHLKPIYPLRDYSMSGWSTDEPRGAFLDSPYGLVLTYKENSQALASGYADSTSSFKIVQVQGIKPISFENGKAIKKSARGLAVLNWDELLLECTRDICYNAGIDTLVIQSGINNRWAKVHPTDGTIHLPVVEALEKYDFLASKLRFSQRSDANWEAPTSQQIRKDDDKSRLLQNIIGILEREWERQKTLSSQECL